ncbi:metal-dependent hydrolase [Haloarchaeobius sp. HRN-SO-5]|uniref:metal-dependent hydrolase n=1 Tax=Haloarchaeobius sp. HRN-SO-5 TaxID=3446118 RepID=UPI003EBA5B90
MVDIMGHLAMGLLWAAPAWFVWNDRVSPAFVLLVLPASLLPDVDLWLSKLMPGSFHHHGVTHTVVFVALVSLVVAGLVAAFFSRPFDRWLPSERFDTRRVFGFVGGAVLVGGLSHLFADVLSAPDIASPIEPLWPLYPHPFGIDLIWYNSPVWNVGLLTVAVALHVGLAYATVPFGRSYSVRRS